MVKPAPDASDEKPMHISNRVSDQQQALHAGMTLLADDDVIMNGDAERFGRLDDQLGHLDVGARRRRVA